MPVPLHGSSYWESSTTCLLTTCHDGVYMCVCVCVGMLTPRDDGCGYGLYMSSMLATYNSKLHNDEIPDGN